MDDWAWEQLAPWLQARVQLPVGPLFCIVNGATRGRPWAAAAARCELRRVARQAGVRRRFAPHQLRHAHAVEMAREGVPLIVTNASSGTPTSASPPFTYRASTTQRSSTPSTPAARRWSPYTARSRLTPRPAAGKLTTSSPPVLVQIASQEPGVASGPQGAPIIAKQQHTRRKWPAPFVEGALTQRYG